MLQRLFTYAFLAGTLCQPYFVGAQTTDGEKGLKICLPIFREELTSLAVLAAQDQKFFEKAGLDIEIEVGGGDVEREGVSKKDKDGSIKRQERTKVGSALPLLNYGDRGVGKSVGRKNCHFGSTTIEQFLMSDNEKTLDKTKPLFISSYGEGYDTNLIVSAKSKIKTLKDLKGKRVRMGQLPNRLALETMLKKEGLGLADIDQVYGVEPVHVLAKLENGELDAAITYIPSMPYMLASGKVRVLKQNIMSETGLAPLPHSIIIVNKNFAERNPEVEAKFLAAMKESFAYLQRNPSQLILILARNNKKFSEGNWTVDKTIAERSGAFVGKLNLANLTESPAVRAQTLKDVQAYSEKLRAAKFFKKSNDLSGWFNVTAPKTASLPAGSGH